MGDSEKAIPYTPEELAEINRIVGTMSTGGADEARPPASSAAPAARTDDEYFGEPEDLDHPSGDFESLDIEDSAEPARSRPAEEAYDDDFSLDEESIDLGDEIDLEEESAVSAGEFDDELTLDESDLAEISAEDLQDITEFVQVEDEVRGPDATAPGGSPLDQLDALTAGEPESLDVSDISDDAYLDEGAADEFAEAGLSAETDFAAELAGMEAAPASSGPGVSLEKEAEVDIPDLDDISLDEVESIPEAGDDDIPEIDLASIAADDGVSGVEEPGADELIETDLDEIGADDLVDLGNITDIPVKKVSKTAPLEPEERLPDVGISDEDFDDIDRIDIGDIDDTPSPSPARGKFTVEPLDEDESPVPPRGARTSRQEEFLELSDRELKRLKKAILLFNPALIREIKDVIVNDLLAPADTRQLVDFILSGRQEEAIRRFLERRLGRRIELKEEGPSGRKVLYSRAEYTREGRERQRRLFRMTKIFAIAGIAAFFITITGYQYLYKPYMAKKLIAQGVELIRERGDYQKKPEDYRKAEGIFKDVNENYREDYLPGYISYGRAYFDMKEYSASLQKLNGAFSINPADHDTLNALGHFYARVPAEYYRQIRNSINTWYYKGTKKEIAERSQLDIAINFYKMVLQRDKNNITALYGIGNAYYHQGQYLKAKKYYEDILRADPGSVIGYAGLLNLYIERDSFAQAATLHAAAREKGLMTELPSPLLGKLAEYYLSKRRIDDSSVRIDYGVLTPRIKDAEDNTYPAVLSVLNDLARRDPDYPPLQVHWARLNRAQKNYAVMEKYLKRALDLSPNYFGALHLLGQYYYLINDPVRSYEYLNRAVNANAFQPEFALDDFYRETEDLGRTHMFLGNIFYYYFDRIRYRYGSLEDELIEDDRDRYLNYSIAREKYEEALKLGHSSPEVNYNLGRVYYMGKLYREALDRWLTLYEEFVTRPELMFSLGNAFYNLGNYDAGKGEYLKLADAFEMDAESISLVQKSNKDHIRIFRTLSATYNNLGAIYQIQNNESKSALCYWKSIDYAKRLDQENEFARINLARSFNRTTKSAPILDEEIPFSLDVYREDMR
jgi:tetratricopeptide (TPR) repeat protein